MGPAHARTSINLHIFGHDYIDIYIIWIDGCIFSKTGLIVQRYQEFAEIIIDQSNKKRRYGTLYYPTIEQKSTDVFIITNLGHRLDLLSYQYYGDVRFWPIIARANKLHNATIRPPLGIRLRIPYPLDYDEIQTAFNEANEND